MITSGASPDFPAGLVNTPLQVSPQLLNSTFSVTAHPSDISF
jgi:hypothetical protein